MLKRLTLITATLFLALALIGSVSATSDIGVTKSVNNSTPNVGGTVNFTINVTNNGPDEAAQVYVQDYISTASNGLQYVSHSASQGTYDPVTGLWNITNFANGATATLILEAYVTQSGNVTNIAAKIVPQPTAIGGEDPNTANDMAAVTLTVPPAADLQITKWVNNTRPNIGDTIRFYVEIRNNGPDNATNVIVQDILPFDVTGLPGGNNFVDWDWINVPENGLPVSLSRIGNNWTIFLTNIGPNDYGLAYIDIFLNNTTNAGQTFTNTATLINSTPYDWNSTNNQSSAEFRIPAADVVVTKQFNGWTSYLEYDITTANYNGVVMYRVHVTNNGPDNATGLQITDMIPAGLTLGGDVFWTYVTSYDNGTNWNEIPDGTYNTATGVWTIPYDLVPGNEFLLDVWCTVTGSNMTIINMVNKTAQNEYDPISDNNNDTANMTVPPAIDLELTKTVNDGFPNYLDVITWTITVTNYGPDNATNVNLSDLLPAGLVLQLATPSQGTYDNVTGVWSVGTLNGGSFATLVLQTLVNATGTITNTANASADQYDWYPAQDSVSASIEVQAASDIQVIKSADNYSPNYGDNVSMTVDAINNGPDNATGVTILDVLPAGFVLTSWTATMGTYDNATGIWSIGDLSAFTFARLTLNGTINATGLIVNNASLNDTDMYDWNSTNDFDQVTLNVPPAADIQVSKSATNYTPNHGDTVVFSIAVTNNGPDDATGVQVVDLLSTDLLLALFSVDQGTYDNVTGLWDIGNITRGNTVVLLLTTTVLGHNTTISNTASLNATDLYDWNNTNNATTINLFVPPAADVEVEKTVDDDTPNYLDNVTFTVTVTNNGPDTAVNVLLSDILQADFSYMSDTPSQGSYDPLTGIWTIGDLANGASATLTLVAQVIGHNNETFNDANASSETYDWNLTNNNASVNIAIPAAADVMVTKEFLSIEFDPISTANYDETILIRVHVTNNGPDNASGIQITDLVPTGLTYGIYTPDGYYYWTHYYSWIGEDGSWNSATGVWTIPYDLAPGEEFLLDIWVTVTDSNMTIVNWANKTAQNEYDWNTTNDNATASLIVPPAADVGVTKTVDEPNPDYLDNVTFTVTVTNNGPDTAVNVLLSDLLPAGFSLTGFTPSIGSYDTTTGVWTVGDLANGTFATLQLVAQVIASNTTITNYANASSETYDWYLANNSASADVTVPPAANLQLTKTVDEDRPNYMDIVNFTITVTNSGPDTAVNARVSDLLPGGLIFVSATPSVGSYNSTTGVWNIGNLLNGTSATLNLVAQVVLSNTTITNFANASSDVYNPDTEDAEDSVDIDVPPAADIGVEKRVSNSNPLIGDTIIWTIFVTNYGPDDANDVEIYDMIPAGLTYVSYSATQGIFYPGASNWNWVIGNMSAFSVVRLDITTIVNPANGSSNVTNNASVLYVNEYDWYTQNDESSATIYLPISDLSITKSADKTSINVGEDVLWTVTLSNNGPANATNIVVTDLLSGLATWYNINGVTPSVGSFDDLTGIWTIPSLANGTFATLVINMTALAPSAGHNIVNTVNVTGLDQFDPTNATANATVYVKAVDIVVNKTVNNSTPNYRSNVTFTVTAHNNGPDNATGVVLTDVWPAGLTLVSATPTLGSYNNATGVWTIGNLANGATATLTLVAQVMDANKTITNVVNLTAVNEYDTNTANNGSSVSIVIPASADIAVTKTTNSTDPLVCENFQWTVTVVNNGPNDATGVVVTDLLPAGLNLVSFTPSQGTYNTITGVWNVGTLLNGSTATLVLVTNATEGLSGVTVTNTANKTAENQYDWNSSNNIASASITVPAKKTFTLGVKNNGSGRIHAIYYVTIYQPCAAPIFKKYDFYLNAGQSTSFNIGTFVVGANVSTDEFVYNAATSVKTVNVANTWTATGIAPYVQNFVLANVPANQARAAHAMLRFRINRTTLGVQIVVPPHLL